MSDRQNHSFVLRIWRERGDASSGWRGWVQHAASGDAYYVDRLADLVAFLETHTGPLGAMSQAGAQAQTMEGEK